MQNYNITSLSGGVQQAVLVGLANLKIAAPSDKVAVVSDDIGTPVRAPEGSPVSGQIARPQGAPVEPFIELIVDTSTFTEATTDIFCKIGDGSSVHKNGCFDCAGSGTNEAFPIIGDATCNLYETFINKLCSRPMTFVAVKVEVSKAATNSTVNSVITLPKMLNYSRKNMNGDGVTGTVHVELYEKDENYPNPNKRYASVPLVNDPGLFDSDTQWTIKNLVGGRIYKLQLFTGVQG